MNREQTLQAIKVMQHYADGGEVEARMRSERGAWGSLFMDGPRWDWDSAEYRIQPKPLECWVVCDKDLIPVDVYRSKGHAEVGSNKCADKWPEDAPFTIHRVIEP